MRNGSIFWGIGLVLLGGVLLAQTTGVIPPGVNVWAIFWSTLLVLFGVSMLVRALGGGSSRRQEAREPLQGARRVVINFRHGAGELRVAGGAEEQDLFSGTFGGGVNAKVRHVGDTAMAELSTSVDTFPFFGAYSRGDLDWNVSLNPAVPLELSFELGASRNLLNLRDLLVKELRLQTGASATELEFPAQAGQTHAVIRSGAASVDLRVPAGVAARIHASGGLASIDVDTGRFPRISSEGLIGGEYRSPDYDSAANRLDLDVETGVGAVSIR